MLNSNLHFTQRLEARSVFGPTTLPAGQTGPITFTRNTRTTVVVDNFNTIDPRLNQTPGLTILRQSGPASSRQLARLWLNKSGRPCITALGSTVCQGSVPATPSGGFVHAGIELISIDHRTTGTDVPEGASRAVFAFKLPALFPVGTYDLVANADDQDAPYYLVNGVQTPLDLLPWQPAVHAVTVQ